MKPASTAIAALYYQLEIIISRMLNGSRRLPCHPPPPSPSPSTLRSIFFCSFSSFPHLLLRSRSSEGLCGEPYFCKFELNACFAMQEWELEGSPFVRWVLIFFFFNLFIVSFSYSRIYFLPRLRPRLSALQLLLAGFQSPDAKEEASGNFHRFEAVAKFKNLFLFFCL